MGAILEAISVTKDFRGVRALDDVTCSFEKGRVYAIVGENGAGKSTLLNVFLGVYKPTRGEVRVEGKTADIKSPAQAREEYRIEGVFQSPIAITAMSVAENLFLGEEHIFYRWGLIDFAKLHNRAKEVLSAVDLDVDVRSPAESLSAGELRLVEFAKVLSHNPRIIILDEITASLERDDTARLFETIRSLREQGTTFIFVSHRLRELFEIADECLVLRDGKLAGKVATEDAKEDDLIELMTGRRRGLSFPERSKTGEEKVVLSIKDLNVVAPVRLRNISIDLRMGEIVALAGLRGQGQSELLRCIFGLIPKHDGRIYLGGKEVRVDKPSDAIKNGIIRISDDKEKEELCLTLSVLRNIALAGTSTSLKRFIDLRRQTRDAESLRSTFQIDTPSLDQQVRNLSGGNRQKVVLSKWMQVKPKIILADQPTVGLDVGTKMEAYGILRRLAKEGMAILAVLTEMEEVLNFPDRVLVMREGEIVRELVGEGLKEDELLRSYFERK